MIFFPNVKINIGLRVLARRQDGYHDLETVMYPVKGLCDALEMIEGPGGVVEFSQSGLGCGCPPEENICVRACETVREMYGTGGVRIHLHKNIPAGAGLGGGSADAAFVIKGLNELFGLGLSTERLEEIAARNGSDTPFFIRNVPALATGRGEVLTPFATAAVAAERPATGGWPETSPAGQPGGGEPGIAGSLEVKRIVIVKPDVSVSTAEAYAGVVPKAHAVPLVELLGQPVGCWRGTVFNDFEGSVFARIPHLAAIKETLYDMGALYASMSGSGSALYGIFEDRGPLELPFRGVFTHQEVIG